MATTLREELFKFLNELKAYAELPQDGSEDAAARARVCTAHATRIEQILGHMETLFDPRAASVTANPEDLCIWVVLPSVGPYAPASLIRLADGEPLVPGELEGLGDRNKALIRTLLTVAQNEISGYNVAQQPYPVLPPPYYSPGAPS